MATSTAITSFTREHFFLSNFDRSRIVIDGVVYTTVEHAFQAHKSLDPIVRRRIAGLITPSRAKHYGREYVQLREDWEDVKIDVMRTCLALKFAPGRQWATKLLATGDAELIEGNDWGDHYWGTVDGKGENHLGRLLMERRAELHMVAES